MSKVTGLICATATLSLLLKSYRSKVGSIGLIKSTMRLLVLRNSRKTRSGQPILEGVFW